MKISVITWDAGFRESAHAIDCFCSQDFDKDEFEFIWVDYYSGTQLAKETIDKYPNAKLIAMNRDRSEQWHLGRMINQGVKASKGEILVIPDGDIIAEKDILHYIASEHGKYDDLALYHRRYDEIRNRHCEKSYEIKYLKQNSVMVNPTNYAGCLSLKRQNFERINGYETHDAFAGPGINGMEMYIRLRNASMAIKWGEYDIYHPWHESTLKAGEREIIRKKLKQASADYRWLLPYAGRRQSWIIHSRSKNLDIKANEKQCERYINMMPNINLLKYREEQ